MHENADSEPSAAINSTVASLKAPSLKTGASFLTQHWLPFAVLSVLVLVPCFWHARIEAGDLGSHVYNAWLVDLIHKGQVHDLYVAPQSNNVLFDAMLYELGKVAGFSAAEKIAVSLCVLAFFWGAFALIAAASRRPPWFLTPAIAMVAFGYTFQMGFFNYYLSMGLAFFAIALVWRGGPLDWIAAAALACLVCLAHSVGLATMIGFIAYLKLSQITTGWRRWVPFVLALGVVVAAHLYIIRFRTAGWLGRMFYQMNGADQLALYGPRYGILSMAALAFTAAAIVYALIREKRPRARFARVPQEKSDCGSNIRVAVELWAVLLFSASLIPEVIFLPQFAAPVAFFVSRSTCISAVLALTILACFRPRLFHLAGYGVCAALLFAWLYQDTGRLNRIEAQAARMYRELPYGSRIAVTIGPPAGSRIWFICHALDRACMGQCFTYSNYEPSSGQFWIHSRPGSRTAISSPEDLAALEFGYYRVKPADLPLKQIYQCRVEDVDRLCMRDLVAGERNCPACNNPLYQLMHRNPVRR